MTALAIVLLIASAAFDAVTTWRAFAVDRPGGPRIVERNPLLRWAGPTGIVVLVAALTIAAAVAVWRYPEWWWAALAVAALHAALGVRNVANARRVR